MIGPVLTHIGDHSFAKLYALVLANLVGDFASIYNVTSVTVTFL